MIFDTKEIVIGGTEWKTAPFRFSKMFTLGGGSGQSYIDILLSGVSPLALTNALGLNYLKVFGGTELLPETYLDTVTLSGGCEQRNLPSGYTQVEYLEVATEGGVCFLTGINASVDTDMGITASNITTASAQLLVAQCTSGGDYFRIAKATATQRVIANFGSSSVTDTNTDGLSKFTGSVNKTGFYVNGSLVDTFSSIPSSFTGIGAVDIFRGKYSATTYYASTGARFHSAWVDDNIFLPCRRNSDNQLGIYNTKTGEFILPSGTGTFSAGADVVPTPSTPIDIVCNNGVIKVSKNVFDYEYFYDNYQTYTSSSVGRCPIKLKANTQYTVSTNRESSSTSARVFVVSGSAINWSPNTPDNGILINSPRTVTTDSSGYLCLGIYVSGNNAIPESDFVNGTAWVQIEQGNTVTTYMPYGQIYVDGTQETVTDSLGNTASAERLLAVGTYKDTQEVLTGSVTKRIGIKVLDGTDSWSTDTYGGYRRFYLPNTAKQELSTAFCTHYSSNAEEGSRIAPNNVYISATGAFVIYIALDQTFTTSEQFNTWLAEQYANGTPVIIAFPLATATSESVSGQFLSKSPVTQTAGSIDNLPIAITESAHTVPTPQQPLQINCNNGVLGIDGQGNITVTGTAETVEIDTTGDTATAENLFKVGTYQDVQSVIDGSVTRNVGIKVLDGTENWTRAQTASAFYLDDAFDSDVNVGTACYCNCFKGVSGVTPIAEMSVTGSVKCGYTNTLRRLYIRYSGFNSLSDLTSYLADQYNAGTPVIIVYPLATPTIETVTEQSMSASGNCIVTATGSMNNLELELSYKQSI